MHREQRTYDLDTGRSGNSFDTNDTLIDRYIIIDLVLKYLPDMENIPFLESK